MPDASSERDPEKGSVADTGHTNDPPALLRSSATVGAATMLSRVLGLVRDVVLANVIGANGNADAFFVAFKIPNFLRRLFAEGAFAQAFVPVLADTREKGGLKAVRELVDRVAGVLGGTLLVLTLLTIFASPVVATIFAPGFLRDPAKLALTGNLIKITFPYLLLISLTGFAGAILNTYHRFAVPALTPVLLNLSLIAAALWLTPAFEEPAFALALGVLIAGFAQLLFQVPALAGIDLVPRPRWAPEHDGVKRILVLMVPALFGVSVSQINLLLDTVLASLLPTGSVSWLYYSDRLTELPLGVFAIAIATVILPTLSGQRARADDPAFSETLSWAIRSVLLIAIPATVALAFLAEPLLVTLFQYGAFEAQDRVMAAVSLQAYSLGLGAFMLVKVLAPGFYAREDMKTPVRIGIIAMGTNMVLNLLFVLPLLWWFNIGHAGLALATSVSAWLNAALLYRGLRLDGVLSITGIPVGWMVRVVLATLLMTLVLWWFTPNITLWENWDAWHRGYRLVGLCFGGLCAYAIGLWIQGLRPSMLRR
ncbi:MAG: murein biosynthesis integral membrane protein MurJ [Candidatus Puniceispirillum sp.]|nr:murein biosynthesis integral membrane protein MurJ [Candidatus Puniceispirillum sp.]|tara:strand:- start:2041 stop:3657 length:1617 start_codon:yes stop_codon:yes gene_type:complete